MSSLLEALRELKALDEDVELKKESGSNQLDSIAYALSEEFKNGPYKDLDVIVASVDGGKIEVTINSDSADMNAIKDYCDKVLQSSKILDANKEHYKANKIDINNNIITLTNISVLKEDLDDDWDDQQEEREENALSRLSAELGKDVEFEGEGDFGELVGVIIDGKYIGEFDEEKIMGKTEDEIYNFLKVFIRMNECLNEDVESTIPAQALPHDELFAAIDAIKPGTYVNVGYLNEVTKTYLQAKFTGGRGSEGNPMVRVFKATEIYGRCGIDHEEIQAIKDKRAAGIERHGNLYEIESELGNKIFHVPSTGSELLQIYPRSRSDVKVKYFISLDDEDLRECTRDELEMYCKPSALTPHGEFDASKPMRLNLSKIYWFKNLGRSILR